MRKIKMQAKKIINGNIYEIYVNKNIHKIKMEIYINKKMYK